LCLIEFVAVLTSCSIITIIKVHTNAQKKKNLKKKSLSWNTTLDGTRIFPFLPKLPVRDNITMHQILSDVHKHSIYCLMNSFQIRNLTGDDLRNAVKARITSLMTRYSGEFAHWDVNNEMLHFNFYEQRLGPNASLEFFVTTQDADPLATLFMNEYNVVETCDDVFSTVDTYVARLEELKNGGAVLEGIGLEGHFSRPNIPLMRAILDKLSTLNLPIWFTEIDISNSFDQQTQVKLGLHVVFIQIYTFHDSIKHTVQYNLNV
jgi:GH35 family endo-1,4-beta-xylanase